MALLSKSLRLTSARRLAANPLSEDRGNVLIYVVLVMVIFGLLGVTMVSLFSTSISSSGTRNDTRRAFYMAESGIRYGVSQLRDKDFASKDIDDLNATTYKLPPGEFRINVFGPWFESPSDQSLSGSGSMNLRVSEGEIPSDFLSQIPTGNSNFRLVNRDYINFDPNLPNMRFRPPETGIAQVSALTQLTDTTFNLTLADDFVVAKGEEVCLSIRPDTAQTITVARTSTSPTAARNIFPRLGGAFEIRKRNFSYREARDLGDRIRLIDIKPVSGEKSDPESNIQTDEGTHPHPAQPPRHRQRQIRPGNPPRHRQFRGGNRGPLGRQGQEPQARHRIRRRNRSWTASSARSKQSSNPNFITVDNTEKFLTIGGGSGTLARGGVVQDTRSIGGHKRFCQEVR